MQGNVGVERKFAFSSATFLKTYLRQQAGPDESLEVRWSGRPDALGDAAVRQGGGRGREREVVLQAALWPVAGVDCDNPWCTPPGGTKLRQRVGPLPEVQKCNSRLDVVRVACFLKEMGLSSTRTNERINVWTGRQCKLGRVKGTHFWKQRASHLSPGTREQWVASRAILRKVWELLRN